MALEQLDLAVGIVSPSGEALPGEVFLPGFEVGRGVTEEGGAEREGERAEVSEREERDDDLWDGVERERDEEDDRPAALTACHVTSRASR